MDFPCLIESDISTDYKKHDLIAAQLSSGTGTLEWMFHAEFDFFTLLGHDYEPEIVCVKYCML